MSVDSVSSSDRARIEWCIEQVQRIADLKRDKLSELYPVALQVVGALARVLEPNVDDVVAACPNCVSRFDEEEVPMFRQGAPTHELEGYVDAKFCTWAVAEIERLNKLLKIQNDMGVVLAKEENA